jgi:hypothetical protein
MTRTPPQWNGYVESGATREERIARLAEVPESMRAGVLSHLKTVKEIRDFADRKKAHGR